MSGPVSRYEHFEILKDEEGEPMKLGLGGMGTTYRAYDLNLRKVVALKLINERALSDPTARRRFFNEARAAASIDHPNVARVIFLCPEDAVQCCFAMELVEGETLARRIAQQGVMSAADALTTLRPIADALIALGARGLVHRDIKPENIMTTRTADGRCDVKLIDFGIAKTTTQSDILESVGTGERFVGSAYFASPEQINPLPTGIDCRSDFYSLGATLWHCVTGAPPFTGTFFEVQEAHIYEDPPWEKIAALPPALSVLLHLLLAKDPNARPADARALVAAWDHAIATLRDPARSGPSTSVLETSTIAAALASTAHEASAAGFLPTGAMPPPASGTLVPERDGTAMRFIRRLSPTLAPELLTALKRAAQTAQDVVHPGLLAIREIDGTSIAVAWPVSVTAAQVAGWYGGTLPAEIILAWLPRIAAAIDAAHVRGLMHLGLQPDRILVAYDPAAAPQAAPDDLGWWLAAKIWLDPLAAFDAALIAAARNHDPAGAGKRAPACSTVREYIAALARAVRDLMGGKTAGQPLPIPDFDETRNHLVSEAISYRVNARTCSEWAQHLIDGVPPARVIPATLPEPVRAEPPPAPPSIPPPQPPAAPTAPALSPGRPWWRVAKVPTRFVAAGLALIALVGGGIWQMKQRSAGEKPGAAASGLIRDGEAALALKDYARALSVIAAAERANPQSPWLADFRTRVESIRPVAPPTTPVPVPPVTPHPDPFRTTAPINSAPVPVTDLRKATRGSPFANQLGLRFIPVPINGGTSHGEIVLFSVYETRVREFEPFATPLGWKRLPDQRDDDPAVNVLPSDAVAFAEWLAKRERLPRGWFYRLPTDHEWSCAVGIGNSESPSQTGSAKNDALAGVHPWGRDWPPPPKAGNFADESLKAPQLNWINGYEDGFPRTAPAGSFPAHASGLFDLAGNAAEWCLDENATSVRYVLRGGSWLTFDHRELLSSHRAQVVDQERKSDRGFRLVLTKTAIPPPKGNDVKRAGGNPPRSTPSNSVIPPAQ